MWDTVLPILPSDSIVYGFVSSDGSMDGLGSDGGKRKKDSLLELFLQPYGMLSSCWLLTIRPGDRLLGCRGMGSSRTKKSKTVSLSAKSLGKHKSRIVLKIYRSAFATVHYFPFRRKGKRWLETVTRFGVFVLANSKNYPLSMPL